MTVEVAPRRRGRPRKFNRPARAVTLTLPEDVIGALKGIDGDLSRAVALLAEPHIADRLQPPAEVTSFGDRAVIVVPRSPQLGDRTGVELVPLSDGRALIAFDDTVSLPQIELRLADAVGDPSVAPADRALFESLGAILRNARRSDAVALRQRSIIIIQHMPRHRARRRTGRNVRPRPAIK